MNAQTVHELYECSAPLYPAEPHNPLMMAEQTAMLARMPPLAGVRALDLACGSGRYARYLSEGGAAQVVALDFSAAMLRRVARGNAVRGDLLTLPLRDADSMSSFRALHWAAHPIFGPACVRSRVS